MKAILNWIISAIVTLGVVVGACFYFIPKYIQKTTSKWITLIDGIGPWFKANWIYVVIVLSIILVVAITLAVVYRRKRF